MSGHVKYKRNSLACKMQEDSACKNVKRDSSCTYTGHSVSPHWEFMWNTCCDCTIFWQFLAWSCQVPRDFLYCFGRPCNCASLRTLNIMWMSILFKILERVGVSKEFTPWRASSNVKCTPHTLYDCFRESPHKPVQRWTYVEWVHLWGSRRKERLPEKHWMSLLLSGAKCCQGCFILLFPVKGCLPIRSSEQFACVIKMGKVV